MSTEQLKKFRQVASQLREKLFHHIDEVRSAMAAAYEDSPKYIFSISLCNGEERARVFFGTGNSPESAWKNVVNLSEKYIRQQRMKPIWIKADVVNNFQKVPYAYFIRLSTQTRRNYLRKGISFDPLFQLAFLEQEVNANGMIRRSEENILDELHLHNINFYLKTYRGFKYPIQLDDLKHIYLFSTISYFYDDREEKIYSLLHGPIKNGRRDIPVVDKDVVYQLIEQSSKYLTNQVDRSGKFAYGYFPSFHRPIKWYNMLRHASTVYSMVEAYEVTKKQPLFDSINRAIEYLITEGIRYVPNTGQTSVAFVVESNNEIKLGANAAAILALSKYSSVFGTNKYMDIMRALASGIEMMQDAQTGKFTHVFEYPNLSVKDEFRIVYYDGEAAFALMRLYELDKNPRWLHIVEKAFSWFIKNDYWKFHDHWLSYCTNELTKYRPKTEYFQFGIQNVKEKLAFILRRDTTYPTFLELMMATHIMIERYKSNHMKDLLQDFEVDYLQKVIEARVKHQLNGFFFPEVAMYFKRPSEIEGAFYIRHHSFRCRIDDIEHNLSGYVNYYHHLCPEAKSERIAEAAGNRG